MKAIPTLALALACLLAPLTASGAPLEAGKGRGPHVKYYRSGTFARVAQVRRNQGYSIPRLGEYHYMALTGIGSCAHIGEWRSVSIRGGPWERKIVVDCSHPRDAARHQRQGLVAEVPYGVAKAYGFVRQGSAAARVAK